MRLESISLFQYQGGYRLSRTRVTTEQRILDLFAEMPVLEQTALVSKLEEFNRFCRKRDGVDKPKAKQPTGNGDAPALMLCDNCGKMETEHVGMDHEFHWIPF